MIQYILFIVLLFYTIQRDNLIEGIEKTCKCGNIPARLIDLRCSEQEKPEIIRRCFPESEQGEADYECDEDCTICSPSTTPNLECMPTFIKGDDDDEEEVKSGGYCFDNTCKDSKEKDDCDTNPNCKWSGSTGSGTCKANKQIFGGSTLKDIGSDKVGKKIDLVSGHGQAFNDFREISANKCDPFNTPVTRTSEWDVWRDDSSAESSSDSGSDIDWPRIAWISGAVAFTLFVVILVIPFMFPNLLSSLKAKFGSSKTKQ